jgi:membrane protease YdiL (CAAX protease family)
MTADVQYPLGAVILGACAGIGEEALFRGAIQPRYGIVLTSLAFALVHSQYGLSFVILGLFLVGVTLGIERKYFGTPAAMMTHAIFNVIAVLVQ